MEEWASRTRVDTEEADKALFAIRTRCGAFFIVHAERLSRHGRDSRRAYEKHS